MAMSSHTENVDNSSPILHDSIAFHEAETPVNANTKAKNTESHE